MWVAVTLTMFGLARFGNDIVLIVNDFVAAAPPSAPADQYVAALDEATRSNAMLPITV